MTEIEKNLRRNIGNKLKLARAKTKYIHKKYLPKKQPYHLDILAN